MCVCVCVCVCVKSMGTKGEEEAMALGSDMDLSTFSAPSRFWADYESNLMSLNFLICEMGG